MDCSDCSSSRITPVIMEEKRPAYRLALLSSAITTACGLVYLVFMGVLAATGGMTFPPSETVQLFGGISTAVSALLLPVLFVSVHYLVPSKLKVYSLLGIVFCGMFSVFVGINRFVQLSVVRISLLEGNAAGLERFLPYDGRSAMFALEMTGWGIFMSLALFFLALALSRRGLQGAARIAFFAYVPLGLTSAIAFMVDSPLSAIGFIAWGLILIVGMGLLLLALRNPMKYWPELISKKD